MLALQTRFVLSPSGTSSTWKSHAQTAEPQHFGMLSSHFSNFRPWRRNARLDIRCAPYAHIIALRTTCVIVCAHITYVHMQMHIHTYIHTCIHTYHSGPSVGCDPKPPRFVCSGWAVTLPVTTQARWWLRALEMSILKHAAGMRSLDQEFRRRKGASFT